MHVPYHVPLRAELPDSGNINLAMSSGARVRGAQDDRATPLDKTPYRANTNVLSLLGEARIFPVGAFTYSTGLARPTNFGLNFLPFGSDGSAFRWLVGVDIGMYLRPITIEAKDVQGPQKVRKGILSGWNWNVFSALGYRFTDWWLLSAGIRRQAYNINRSFTRGIDDEWNLGGDHVTYFIDQGFNFGPWRLDASIFKTSYRFNAIERESKTGLALSAGVQW